MPNNTLQFRPHHFLCALGFQGKGYSRRFIANFTTITEILRGPQGDNTQIEVTEFTDSVCSPCPHKRDKLCATQEKITKLDTLHAKALQLKAGDSISWGAAKQRIREQVDVDKFQQICQGCEWRSLWVCEKALKALREE